MSVTRIVPRHGDTSSFKGDPRCNDHRVPMWHAVCGWVLLLPMLFYTLNGALEARTGPVALRSTATQGDSSEHRVVQLLIGLIICSFLVSNLRSVIVLVKRAPVFFLLPLCALASVFWSEVPRQTLVNAVYLTILTGLALFLSSRFDPRARLELLMMTGAVALFLSLVAVIFVPSIGIDAYQKGAWKGVFLQRNATAAAGVVFGISAAYYEAKGIVGVCLKWFVIVSSALFVVMAGSATGWELTVLACGLGVLLAVLSHLRYREALVLSSVLLIMIIGAADLIYQYRDVILAVVGRDPTLDQRTLIWAITLKSAVLHPWLGYGYTAFWRNLNGPSETAILRTGWMEGQAQSGYIDLILGLGVVGLAAFVITVADAVRRGSRALKSVGSGSVFTRWSAVVIVVMLVYNIGESSIAWCYNLMWLVFLLALIGLSEQTLPVKSELNPETGYYHAIS